MGKLKVYGTPMSRAARALWMCRELGLDFENVPVHFADGSVKTPEYLAVNPNGRIPAIKDGDFALWESMAINLYLARTHESGLTPRGLEEEALAWQWRQLARIDLARRSRLAGWLSRCVSRPAFSG